MPTKPARTLPDFAPVPRKCRRHDGWTPERQRGFIEALADCGSVKSAARAVGMTPESAYYLRRQDGARPFRKAWEAALDLGIERIEDVAMDRALNGVEVPVYAYGKIIGTRRVYNDRLLMFMLRNRAPKRFAADGPRGLNAVDRQMLSRLKKEWRAEWERERLTRDRQHEDSVLESLQAKIAQARQREEDVRHMLADPDGEGTPDAEDDWTCPQPDEAMRKLLPGYRDESGEDDGPVQRSIKDERWD